MILITVGTSTNFTIVLLNKYYQILYMYVLVYI